MALQTIPGLTGLTYARVSSLDKRAIGKFTDTNHLESLQHDQEPQDYDKKIISIYTQTSLVANDFLAMINKSTPFYLDKFTDDWKWGVEKPYQAPKIIDVPATTTSQSNIGLDGRTFEIILDTIVGKNAVISVGSKMYGPQFVIVLDPVPLSVGWLHTCTLRAANQLTDFVDPRFLLPGTEVEVIDSILGEFDEDMPGLGKLADKLTMFESLGAGYGFSHKITAWADDKILKDSYGRPLDIMVYMKGVRNELPVTRNDVKWEPFIEFLLRKQMLETKVKRMIWNRPGISRTNGTKQEIRKTSAGIYYRMKNSGNYHSYNRGEFSGNMLRAIFGDLFYRRVDMKDRRVKMYTNEAGIAVFQQMIKEDAFSSGLQFNTGDNDKFISGSGQTLVYNFAFSGMVTMETGKIEVSHLKELDLPQTNLEFGQNKKSTPIFMVFDVSPTGDGTLANNIREVRRAGTPSMQWGYIDGRRSHLGAMASQGFNAASKFPGYEIWMEDRADIFIEDMSRTVLIEEIPTY